MNFRPELAEAVMAGRKWVTRRAVSPNPRSPYHPGRVGSLIGRSVAICPGRGKSAIGRARVISVARHMFHPDRISDASAEAEGFQTREDFRATWRTIHGNEEPMDVWRIELRPDGGTR